MGLRFMMCVHTHSTTFTLVVIELTVLLAALDIVWPVARVSLLAVKKTSDAKLLGGGSVPAGPVAGARSLVSENTIQPVAVLSRNGRI
jgi:hypothetical protein